MGNQMVKVDTYEKIKLQQAMKNDQIKKKQRLIREKENYIKEFRNHLLHKKNPDPREHLQSHSESISSYSQSQNGSNNLNTTAIQRYNKAKQIFNDEERKLEKMKNEVAILIKDLDKFNLEHRLILQKQRNKIPMIIKTNKINVNPSPDIGRKISRKSRSLKKRRKSRSLKKRVKSRSYRHRV